VSRSAPALYEIGPNRPSWQYWMLNPERFGVVIAVDGRERFVFHSQLPRDVKGTLEYAKESLRLVIGRDTKSLFTIGGDPSSA
jgi:hypothetical protein